jgi:glycosyltransferase involved in cell wall biosynthesis
MANPISILHVMNCCEDGSITRIVERIIHELGGTDFKWYVCGLNGLGDRADILNNLGVQVFDASSNGDASRPAWKEIKRILADQQIKIVHSHTPRTILEAYRALQMPGRKLSFPTIHIATKHLLFTQQDRRWGWFYMLFDRFSLYLPHILVPVSKTMAQKIYQWPGISRSRVVPIPNGIPVAEYYLPAQRAESRNQLGLEPDMIAIGFAGRIMQVKRLDLLLDAFAPVHAQFPETKLILAGEGDAKPKLERLAAQLGITSAVTWLGFCTRIPAFLAALDIYIQPSINEGLSLSILEAMAAEKPVIATMVGAADELIQDGVNGILVPPYSSSALQRSLLDMIQNPDKRYRLASQAHQSADERYDVREMAKCYGRLYREITNRSDQYGKRR